MPQSVYNLFPFSMPTQHLNLALRPFGHWNGMECDQNRFTISSLKNYSNLMVEYRLMFQRYLALILVILHEWKWTKWSIEAICAQKGPISSLYPTHCPFWKHFSQKCTKTLVVVDNILQRLSRVYGLVQYVTVLCRMPQNWTTLS